MISSRLVEYSYKVFQVNDFVTFEIMKGDRVVVTRNIHIHDCGFIAYVFGSHGTAAAINRIFKYANKECQKNLKILKSQEAGV